MVGVLPRRCLLTSPLVPEQEAHLSLPAESRCFSLQDMDIDGPYSFIQNIRIHTAVANIQKRDTSA